MKFFTCMVCKLNLPINMLEMITVNHQGKILNVPICTRCKEIKQSQAKGETKC